MLLETTGLCMRFGGLDAVWDLNLHVNDGEILGLIGPNGSGKTTVFNMITGIYKPTMGNVVFQGANITGLPPYEITKRGISRTFQNIRLFETISVLDNVLVGMHCRLKTTLFDALCCNKRHKESEKEGTDKAMELLEFMGLVNVRNEMAANLSYGNQRRLELARALANEPALLLLDEPTAGMNPQEAATLMEMIAKIRDTGVTVFLIEHNMRVLMSVSDRVVALDAGKKIAEGHPKAIQHDPKVIKAYLGTEEVE